MSLISDEEIFFDEMDMENMSNDDDMNIHEHISQNYQNIMNDELNDISFGIYKHKCTYDIKSIITQHIYHCIVTIFIDEDTILNIGSSTQFGYILLKEIKTNNKDNNIKYNEYDGKWFDSLHNLLYKYSLTYKNKSISRINKQLLSL